MIPHDKVHGWCQKSGAHLVQPGVKGAHINKPPEKEWKNKTKKHTRTQAEGMQRMIYKTEELVMARG